MSTGPHDGSHPSESPVFSPLAHGPKFSPPSSRTTSPPRRPLHERSNSQANQFSGPTIRIVEDPGTDFYSKTPFPSLPSQVLPPRNRPGYAFEGRGSRVSDSGSVANAVAKIEASRTLVPKPLQPKKAIRHSTSTSISDADTLVASSFSPSSSRFSQGSTTASSLFPEEKELGILEEELPPPPPPPQPLPSKSTIRAVTPSTSSSAGEVAFVGHALTPRASAASLASTESSGSLDFRKDPSGISRPLPKSHKHTPSSASEKKKQASSSNLIPQQSTLNASTDSLAFTETSSLNERPRSSTQSSPTIHDARQITLASGVRVHYPIVRAPSASSLRAESQNLPTITSRMNNRTSQPHQWSSQLSTIPSESERESRSIERSSQSGYARSASHDSYNAQGRSHYPRRRRQTVASIASSDNNSSDAITEASAVPPPLFSPIVRPSHDDRESDEHHDTIAPLQSPPLRNKRSGYLRRWDSDSRSNSSRPSSSQSDLSSFISNTIPAWARVYYRRGERASLGAPESLSTESSDGRLYTGHSGRTQTPSESHFPLSIYRPRNRPRQRMSYPETMSLSSEGDLVEQDIYVIGPRWRPVVDFTPRLREDRRSRAHLSAWKAPSIDDSFGTLLFNRQNRQILLFCLGFLFPFAWMIASLLPLPPAQDVMQQEPTPSQVDIEIHLAREFGPVQSRSHQKARWWRNLNRVMSGLGTLLIGAIIALAILASRMSASK